MPVNIIPFNMPDAMEIPEHIVELLSAMEADAAVEKAMELLAGIDAAETMVYERLSVDGTLELRSVYSQGNDADAIQEALRGETFYGQPLNSDSNSLAGAAFEKKSPLLVMGESSGESDGLPTALRHVILNDEGGDDQSGNIGFLYVLPLADADERPMGALTLIRSHENGPLNHEQPNLAEGIRQLLSRLLSARRRTDEAS